MARDVKIVEDRGGVLIPSTWPSPDTVSGEYALVQRIVKNLLTVPGEDAFDPAWGSGLSDALLGIPGQDTTSATRAASRSIQKCASDLMSSQPADPAGRLTNLRLVEVVYDMDSTSWVLSVQVATEERTFTIDTGV